jgi:hypothetical protein
MHTEDKEPDGIAEGQTSSASQQSKHFQCGSATVLCTTVNSEAWPLLGNMERLVRENRVPVLRMDPRQRQNLHALLPENALRLTFGCAAALTCINSVNRIR